MKVKLLKRVRSRFGWYIRKDGHPVLVDRYKQNVTVLTPDAICYMMSLKLDDIKKDIEISMTDWTWRYVKILIFRKMGIPYSPLYRPASTKAKRRENNKTVSK